MENFEDGEQLLRSLTFQDLAYNRILHDELGDELKECFGHMIQHIKTHNISPTEGGKLLVYHAIVSLGAGMAVEMEDT